MEFLRLKEKYFKRNEKQKIGNSLESRLTFTQTSQSTDCYLNQFFVVHFKQLIEEKTRFSNCFQKYNNKKIHFSCL